MSPPKSFTCRPTFINPRALRTLRLALQAPGCRTRHGRTCCWNCPWSWLLWERAPMSGGCANASAATGGQKGPSPRCVLPCALPVGCVLLQLEFIGCLRGSACKGSCEVLIVKASPD